MWIRSELGRSVAKAHDANATLKARNEALDADVRESGDGLSFRRDHLPTRVLRRLRGEMVPSVGAAALLWGLRGLWLLLA